MSVVGTVLHVLYKKAQQNCQQQTYINGNGGVYVETSGHNGNGSVYVETSGHNGNGSVYVETSQNGQHQKMYVNGDNNRVQQVNRHSTVTTNEHNNGQHQKMYVNGDDNRVQQVNRHSTVTINGTTYTDDSCNSSAHVDFRLQVPNRCNVEINGGATRVDLQKISGDINAKVGSGNVTLNDVQGNLDIKTDSGKVYLSNCLAALKNMTQQGLAARYLIETESSNISLHNPYAQQIIASTVSGSINMRNIMASKVETSTGCGDIEASYSPDSPHKGSFNFSTGSGSVKIELPRCVKVAQNIRSRHIKSDFVNTNANPDLVIKGSIGSGTVRITASN